MAYTKHFRLCFCVTLYIKVMHKKRWIQNLYRCKNEFNILENQKKLIISRDFSLPALKKLTSFQVIVFIKLSKVLVLLWHLCLESVCAFRQSVERQYCWLAIFILQEYSSSFLRSGLVGDVCIIWILSITRDCFLSFWSCVIKEMNTHQSCSIISFHKMRKTSNKKFFHKLLEVKRGENSNS